MVNTSGTYNISSLSHVDAIGYLYQGNFYPSNRSIHLFANNDDYNGTNQFKLTAFLEGGTPYTLVVTTFGEGITGSFSIVASGPDSVHFIPINYTINK
jgi:hypothetical protein